MVIICLNLTLTVCFSQNNRLNFQLLQNETSSKFIRSIIQDSSGYLWFGTNNGLFRFDGLNLNIYEHNPNQPSSICHNTVNQLFIDDKNQLWIATANGIAKYNYDQNNFTSVDNVQISLNHLNNSYISSIFVTHSGTIYAGTLGNGLNIYHPESKTFEYISINPTQSSEANYVNQLIPQNDTHLWIATWNGLYLLNQSTNTIDKPDFSGHDAPVVTNGHIFTGITDTTGKLWIYILNHGLFTVEKSNLTCKIKAVDYVNQKLPLEKHRILSLSFNKNDLLIGVENLGLSVFDTLSHQQTSYKNDPTDPNSLPGNSVWSIYFDHHSKLWLGLYNKGVALYDEYYSKFKSYQFRPGNQQSVPNNNIKCFASDAQNKLWIGTDGGGITLFNELNEQFEQILNTESTPKLNSNAVMDIIHDGSFTWVAYWNDGIDRIDRKRNTIQNFKVQGEGSGQNKVQCLFKDDQNRIWAGTAGSGLFLFNKPQRGFIQSSNIKGISIPANGYVSDILQDKNGNIWVATLFGLYQLEMANSSFKTISYYADTTSKNLNTNRINCLFEDRQGQLWIGTTDRGLLIYQNQRFSSVVLDSINPNLTITGITRDLNQMLWISTNKGIFYLDPIHRFVKKYTTADGLVANDFYLNAIYTSPLSMLYFGSSNGFNSINPVKIANNPIAPKMHFTQLTVNNQTITPDSIQSILQNEMNYTHELKLKYNQNSFSISYAGITYSHPEQNRYQFQLIGFNSNWVDAGHQTTATYTNISPGKYLFRVKGANNDGVWNPTPIEIKIIITPPVWKTWWAILLYYLVISLIAAIVLRSWIGQIKLRNELKFEKLAHKKEKELTEQKLQFFTNISHEIRTPLSLILAPIEQLFVDKKLNDSQSKLVVRAFNNSKRLMELIDELLDFRKTEKQMLPLKVSETNITEFFQSIHRNFSNYANDKGLTLQFNEPNDQTIGWFDESVIYKIISNLLSNALKFTPKQGTITLQYSLTLLQNTEWLTVSVTDTGIGIKSEHLPLIFDRFFQADNKKYAGTGIGLTLVKNLVQLHKGEISVNSEFNKGTTFEFKVPVSGSAFNPDEILTDKPVINVVDNNVEYMQPLNTDSLDQSNKSAKPILLIIEDNTELLSYLNNELSHHYQVNQACNGSDGHKKALELIPDLIISDVMMPEMDGIELCKILKKDTRTSHIPIVILSAKTTVLDQIAGLSEGADLYIPKPFSITLLKSQINQLIENRRQLFQQFSQNAHILPASITRNKNDQEFLIQMIELIIEHINDKDLGINLLATKTNLSHDHIYKKIKSLTGETAVEFIRTIKLKEALKLLESQKYTIAEIAFQTGFSTPSYFTRSFKKQFGKAPSDIIKQ